MRSPDRIRHEIEELRGELGSTVQALAAKADVKAQARERAEEVRSGLRERTPDRVEPVIAAARHNPVVLYVGVALLAGFLIGRAVAARRTEE